MTKGAFQMSELAGQTMTGAAFWPWNRLFPTVFAEKPSPSCIVCRIWRIWLDSFDFEILITTGMVWQVSSDKWKAL